MRPIIALLAASTVAASTAAQSYLFTIDARGSFVDTSLAVSTPLTGTFIGDFDEVTNPGGTKTIPGLFGGSGNNPIGYNATLAGGAAATTPPDGTFKMAIDVEGLTVAISGLSLDLLGGDTVGFDVTLTINYDTFHTQNPSAIFPGGFDIPIPLGEVATIDFLVATQTGDGAGALIPVSPGVYTLTAVVAVDLVIVATVNGEPVIDRQTIPAVIPVVGTLDLTQIDPTVSLELSNSVMETIPIDAQAFDNVPVPLPTILPPGGTANLLLSGTLTEFVIDATSDIDLVAVGEPQCAFADLNCDGVVNGADLGIMLGAWGPCGEGECIADLNGDGEVNGADLGLLLGAWS